MQRLPHGSVRCKLTLFIYLFMWNETLGFSRDVESDAIDRSEHETRRRPFIRSGILFPFYFTVREIKSPGVIDMG